MLNSKANQMYKILKKIYLNNRDTFFLIFGNALSRIIFLLISFIVIKVSGSVFYGKYALIYNLILVFQVFVTFGMASIVTKKVANGFDVNIIKKIIFKNVCVISFFIFGLIFVFFNFFTVEYFSILKEINFIFFMFAVIALVFYTLMISFLFGLYDKRTIAKYNIINMLLIFIFLIFSSLVKNLNLMIVFFGLANLITGGVVYKYINNNDVKKNKIHNRDLLKESFPVFLSELLVTPTISILLYWLSQYDFQEVSVFSVAMQWFSIVLFIPGVLANLFLSKFSRKNNINTNVYFKSAFLNFSLGASVGCILISFLYFVLPMYGEIYINNIYTFIIIILSGVFSSLSVVAGQYLVAKDKQYLCFIFNFLWALIVLSSSYYLLRVLNSVIGIAIAYLIAYLIHAALQNLYIYVYGRLEND